MFAVPLVIALFAAQPPVELGAAETILLTRLRKDQAFPSIKPDCLYVILDNESHTEFQFSVRFDQEKCGGNSASDLLDRFVVTKLKGTIKHYEVAGCFTNSYALWLKHQKARPPVRLTQRSTRTQPLPSTRPQ